MKTYWRLNGRGESVSQRRNWPWIFLAAWCLMVTLCSAQVARPMKEVSVNGGIKDGKARIIIEGDFGDSATGTLKSVYSTSIQQAIRIARDKASHSIQATFDVLQGDPAELVLTITGLGEITKVTGDSLQDWSVRLEGTGQRHLVLRPKSSVRPVTRMSVMIQAETPVAGSEPIDLLTLAPLQTTLFDGYVRLDSEAGLDVRTGKMTGLIPIETRFLPNDARPASDPVTASTQAFRFHGSSYSLPVMVGATDPEAREVVLKNFNLKGQIHDKKATFTLTALARVQNPNGASIELLSGSIGLTEVTQNPHWRLVFEKGSFWLKVERPGEYPISITFDAAVTESQGTKAVQFRVAPSALQPVVLQGLPAETQLDFASGARPQKVGTDFVGFLPADGSVDFSWREAEQRTEAKLFYSAEMLSQVSISSGLMRQTAVLDFKVMQGELNQVSMVLRGPGSVTRVQGLQVLSWKVEPSAGGNEQRLLVQLNQAQKDRFVLVVQMQTQLAAFPQSFTAVQVRPEGVTRFGGHLRVVNEGAVRLEVIESNGLSQMAPEQFPVTDSTQNFFTPPGNQRFVFRFSTVDYSLKVQADHVLPEVSVSELLTYHFGENEQAIDVEMELDVREAPLRELTLRIPRGYSIAKLVMANLNDFFVTDDGTTQSLLRLVFGQPLTGRQVVQLRLERNAPLGNESWNLPRVEVLKSKSTRGHVGITADSGLRLNPERTQGLVEIATAYFPKKLSEIQSAFRMNEPAWEVTLKIERLPQSVQADVFHLFSIGEGIGYGSSTMNYLISGAPISVLNVELAAEYKNVEFTGRDIRNWQKTTNGYAIQLHSPVSGNYVLLATYERPFKPQGDTLTFTGARPLDAPTEQGHTVVISANQFEVKPAKVSASLLAIEPSELPAEYRLLFDAPILAAYRYTARPFDLQLGLSRLNQVSTLSLVVDRADLRTRISKDGEVITDIRYFVKTRGNPHLRLELPPGVELWSAKVNGVAATAVKDQAQHLIPLQHKADPNAVQEVTINVVERSKSATRVGVHIPKVQAPILLAEWHLQADAGQRLIYRDGSLTPQSGGLGASGWVQWKRLLRFGFGSPFLQQLFLSLGAILVGIISWRWATRAGTYRGQLRHVTGGIMGAFAFGLGLYVWFHLIQMVNTHPLPVEQGMSFIAPVQNEGTILFAEVSNRSTEVTLLRVLGWTWPVLLGLLALGYALLSESTARRRFAQSFFWTMLVVTALQIPQGVVGCLVVMVIFILVQIIWPGLRQLGKVPQAVETPANPATGAASSTALLLLAGSLFLATQAPLEAAEPKVSKPNPAAAANKTPTTSAKPARLEPAVPEWVEIQLRVDKNSVAGTAKLRWLAQKDQLLPVLFEPAVLTEMNYPTNSLKMIQGLHQGRRAYQVLALQDGAVEIGVKFQQAVTSASGQQGFKIPVVEGLVNRTELTLMQLDVDIAAPQAISVNRATVEGNTVARVNFPPIEERWIGWLPRSRDTRGEKSVFYVEWEHLYMPVAGVVEGVHLAKIRPAQGELSEMVFTVPAGVTISDVGNPASLTALDAKREAQAETPLNASSLWRFDPDTRQLRVTLSAGQSRPFFLLIRSQLSAGPLPYEQKLSPLSLENAAGQVGLLGLATGSEVQLDAVEPAGLADVNLEDFGSTLLTMNAARIHGLTLKRAYRYTDPNSQGTIKVSAVKPDVRIESQQTLSLGDDRIVLAANLQVAIARAGIFRLSFVLPETMAVESVSGEVFSHWTELVTPEGKIITLHLKGKTEGQHALSLTLTGPGAKVLQGWVAPRLVFRDASKQTGQLVIVAEHGIRPQVAEREGMTQMDPQKSGLTTPGLLAFRLLQPDWKLSLNLEVVDAWVQVNALQHVVLTEAQMKVSANLIYQVENAGLKSLKVRLPANAESIRFRGEHVADFLKLAGDPQDGLQTWEVKLHRRILGKYLLQVHYQMAVPEKAVETTLRGLHAADANLQRGFVTLESVGRLEVRVETLPSTLQTTEWQSIPRGLLQDMDKPSAHFTFRTVEPIFQLPLKLERHAVAKLLPARVLSALLSTTVSDEGSTLTHVRLELSPGDKRLLEMQLPPKARFWFAFVNQNGVWPWTQGNSVLIPLDPSRNDQAMVVEIFYSRSDVDSTGRSLDLGLVSPKFDLPLENITWRVFLNDQWKLTDWEGSLQLENESVGSSMARMDLQTYLQNEMAENASKTRKAEGLLNYANDLLVNGDPQQARKAYQAAFGMSQHDNAFNEDARVQLHNLKLQQALVGLNVRQAAVAGEGAKAAGPLRQFRARKDLNYTQQEAKELMEANDAGENAALTKLAERLIQQQDAATTSPSAIRAAVPEQGKVLTFRRAVQVQTGADLKLNLEAKASPPMSTRFQVGAIGVILVTFFLGLALVRKDNPARRA